MIAAIKEAKKAYAKDEVPVGCVIVVDGKIIARGHNLRETKKLVTSHAEIIAITKASKKLDSWRLENASIYVTLEPCVMCSGAIIQSRIKNLYFGAYDYKAGAAGSVLNVYSYKFNHIVNVAGGIMEEECKALLQSFFAQKRIEKKSTLC